MYRILLPILVYIGATSPAPQDNSDITYVQIQPTVGNSTSEPGSLSDESKIEKLPLTVGGNLDDIDDSDQPSSDVTKTDTDRHLIAREIYTTPIYEYETTEVTERYEIETTTFVPLSRKFKPINTKVPSPRYYSKLSYFQKANDFGSASTNLVEKTGKRLFKSKCRCERIWNCPKLQITVPRCPEEYFMCCF